MIKNLKRIGGDNVKIMVVTGRWGEASAESAEDNRKAITTRQATRDQLERLGLSAFISDEDLIMKTPGQDTLAFKKAAIAQIAKDNPQAKLLGYLTEEVHTLDALPQNIPGILVTNTADERPARLTRFKRK